MFRVNILNQRNSFNNHNTNKMKNNNQTIQTVPRQIIRTVAYEDLTCQQLQQNPERWQGVAQKIHEEWSRCLHEIQIFEELLEQDEIRRMKYARWFKFGGIVIMGLQNIVATASAAVPFTNISLPDHVPTVLAGLTWAFSLALWSRLGETSNRYLSVAEDSKRLKLMCRNIRKNLKDIMSDGKITEKERNLIRDMMGQMHRRSEEIGSMNLFMNILGGVENKSQRIKLFGSSDKSYQDAFEGISDIIDEIGKAQQTIKVKAPEIVREYEDSKLQVQIHSNAIPGVVQRDQIQHDENHV